MLKKLDHQITFVSHYGEKDQTLANYFDFLQKEVSKRLLNHFIPYEIPQIHGTIIGLETIIHNGTFINKNYADNSRKNREFDVENVLNLIRTLGTALDLKIQLGGFEPNRVYQFGQSKLFQPYQEAFAIRGHNILIKGWPFFIETNKYQYSTQLNQIRQQFKSVNVLHKYFYDQKEDFDNDFFLVLGKVSKEDIPHSEIADIEQEMRQFISEIPIYTNISQETLSILFYTNKQVPLSTTTQISLNSEEINHLSKENIENWLRRGISITFR